MYFYQILNNGLNFIEYRITGPPLRHPHIEIGDVMAWKFFSALLAICEANPPITRGSPQKVRVRFHLRGAVAGRTRDGDR